MCPKFRGELIVLVEPVPVKNSFESDQKGYRSILIHTKIKLMVLIKRSLFYWIYKKVEGARKLNTMARNSVKAYSISVEFLTCTILCITK